MKILHITTGEVILDTRQAAPAGASLSYADLRNVDLENAEWRRVEQ